MLMGHHLSGVLTFSLGISILTPVLSILLCFPVLKKTCDVYNVSRIWAITKFSSALGLLSSELRNRCDVLDSGI